MYDQDRKSVDPDSWDPLSAERFKGQIRSISADERDVEGVADVADVAAVTDVADVTNEIYQLPDELKPEEAA